MGPECARAFYSSLVYWTKGWNGKKTETNQLIYRNYSFILYKLSKLILRIIWRLHHCHLYFPLPEKYYINIYTKLIKIKNKTWLVLLYSKLIKTEMILSWSKIYLFTYLFIYLFIWAKFKTNIKQNLQHFLCESNYRDNSL